MFESRLTEYKESWSDEYALPKLSIGKEKYYVQYKGVLTPLCEWFSK